jgi:hypothetical protein
MPVFWFWLPVLDCVRLMTTRMLAGKSPMAGDRDHFHHMLHDYIRMRYALIVYLALLAAPGAAAELSDKLGGVTLLICMSGYAAFVVFRQVRIFQAQTAQPDSDAPSFVASGISMLTPSARRRVVNGTPHPQAEVALEEPPRQVSSGASV